MTIYESCQISCSSLAREIHAAQEIKNNFHSRGSIHRVVGGARDFVEGRSEGFFQCPFCNGCGSVAWSEEDDDDRVLVTGNGNYSRVVEPAAFEHSCGQYLTVLRSLCKTRII